MPLQRIGPNNRAGNVPVANVAPQPRGVLPAAANEDDPPPIGPRDRNSDDENPLAEERGEAEAPADEGTVAHCCLPGGCGRPGDLIYLADPGPAVKMICNNESCTAGEWMHGDCFQEWERHVLNYLRSCGRARSWSEKQRLQNLWTKKGYDLAFKACDCKCAKGHLRKDLGYIPPPAKNAEVEKRQRRVRKVKPPQRRGSTGATQTVGESTRTPLRIRTSSLCSTGSSPPSSEGMSPQTSSSLSAKSQQQTRSGGKFEFFADADQAAAGNIFHRRTDLSAFRRLPIMLQNPYQIKVEDEGPHGNDETRSFILTNLSSQKVTVVSCVVCQVALPVYDKYPLVDGTFFLSPLKYSVNSVPVQQVSPDHQHRRLHLSAVCMQCLSGANMALMCVGCQAQWTGATLIIGTMYAYDIFAANPCCPWRLGCKACARQVIEAGNAYQFYSQYSRLVCCSHCGSEDFHFVKPLHDLFRIVGLQR